MTTKDWKKERPEMGSVTKSAWRWGTKDTYIQVTQFKEQKGESPLFEVEYYDGKNLSIKKTFNSKAKAITYAEEYMKKHSR